MARGSFALATLALAAALGAGAQASAPLSLPESLTMRAAQKLQSGDMAGALNDANLAILRDSQNSPAHALRGTIRMTSGNRLGALADYSRAIELTPTMKGMEVVYTNRANLHWLAGDRAAAAVDLEQAFRLNDAFALAFNVRARLKADAGDLDGARADYDRAIQLEPRMMPAYAGRAAVHLQAGRLQESISDYKTLMWTLPGDADVVAYHGILRGLLGETEAAVADLLRARAMNPRSVSDASRGPANSPARGLEQFVEMNPNEARAHLMRGLLHLVNGKRESADQEFERAVSIDGALRAEVTLARSRL